MSESNDQNARTGKAPGVSAGSAAAGTGRTSVRRSVRPQLVLRRNIEPQEMLALVGGFLLLMLLMASTLTAIIHPLFPLAALIFFLYPFRRVIVPRRTMQLGFMVFMVWLFLNLSGVLAPFIIAFVIAYLFSPLVARFEKKGVPRWATALTFTLCMLGVYAVVGMFVIPGLIQQIQDLINSAKGPNSLLDTNNLITQLEELGMSHQQANDLVTKEVEPKLKEALGWLFTNFDVFLKNAATILEGVVNLLLIPLLSMYMMIDFTRIRAFVRTKVIRDNPRYVYYLRQVDLILSAYLRGILITSTMVGTLAVIILTAFGVPYAVVIGILTGVFNLIPSVGIFLNLGIAMIVFLFVPEGFLYNTVITAAMVLGLHALNGYVVEPRIVGDRVGLPPVMMIASLFVFAHFLGFIGLLVAVPLSAVIAMFIKEWYKHNVAPPPDPVQLTA